MHPKFAHLEGLLMNLPKRIMIWDREWGQSVPATGKIWVEMLYTKSQILILTLQLGVANALFTRKRLPQIMSRSMSIFIEEGSDFCGT